MLTEGGLISRPCLTDSQLYVHMRADLCYASHVRVDIHRSYAINAQSLTELFRVARPLYGQHSWVVSVSTRNLRPARVEPSSVSEVQCLQAATR